MLDISFTPVRHQLQTDFSKVSERTQFKVIRKARNAVDAVLEAVAPGQGAKLRHTLLADNRPGIDESRLIQCMRAAIEQSTSKKDAQQLLSVYCGKDENGKYLLTKEQLLEYFPSITVNDIDKSSERANNNLQGVYLSYIFLFIMHYLIVCIYIYIYIYI